jgi:ATP-dependent DNA helicase PIF1
MSIFSKLDRFVRRLLLPKPQGLKLGANEETRLRSSTVSPNPVGMPAPQGMIVGARTRSESIQELQEEIESLKQQLATYNPPSIMMKLPPASMQVESGDRERLIAALRSDSQVVLLHGRAGTGKTTLVRSLKQEGFRHRVVAPTGIAALNAGGQTIHKFFGVEPRIVNLDDIGPAHRLGTILRNTDLLVIDEISMVRADLLDVIDRKLRVNLRQDKPFGGIKILLVGDFLQLPPIVNRADAPILANRGYEVPYAFGAQCLIDLPVKYIELSTVYRQTEFEFLELLRMIRNGENLEQAVQQLNDRCYREHRASRKPITLTARIDTAHEYNDRGLATLPGDAIRLTGVIKDDFRVERDKLPAPEYLDLKKGARILMVKNDPERRWVNGTLGTVTGLSETSVRVQLDGTSNEAEVYRATWESIEYRHNPMTQRVDPIVVGTYTQFPLVPAWAMTIHKAQGLTLEDLRIDLGHGAFSPGQTYTALSRVRTLDGLSFSRPLRTSDVMAEPKLVEAVRRIAAESKN